MLSVIFVAVITSCAGIYRHGYHDTKHLPFQLDSGALAFSFAIIGFWIKKWDIASVCLEAYRAVSKKVLRFGVMAGMLGIYSFLALYNAADNYVNMADNVLGNSVLVYYVAGSLMFLLLITMGQLLNPWNNRIVRWTCLLGRHSLLIYLGHMLIMPLITEAIRIRSNNTLILTPMINLDVKWGLVFFAVIMTALTAIYLLKEYMERLRNKG